jgi:glucose-1-phosphate adenylyltransferase
MDLLGPEPKIDLEAWGIRTNLGHRNIADRQPVKIGAQGSLENSMAYNGCIIEGTVRNSILFPGVHVKAGAEINDSIVFFDNIIHEGVHLNRVVSDVNTVFNKEVRVGGPDCGAASRVSVIGWNNSVPEGFQIGCGCRVNPRIAAENWPTSNRLEDGGEL